MKLSQDMKRMLDALAYANAGDYLSLSQKSRVLAGAKTSPTAADPQTSHGTRPQVGLYLGSELSADAMQYVAQTCARLRYGLTVLTFLSEGEVQELLTPLRPMLDAAGIELRLVVLSGEPPAALVSALRRRPEVAFLVCNEAGYLAHGMLSGNRRNSGMPVPVVMVAAREGVAAQHTPTEAPAIRRAA